MWDVMLMYRMWQSCKCVLVTAPRRRLQMFTLMHSKLIGAQCPVWSGSPMIKWSVKNPFFSFPLCARRTHFQGFYWAAGVYRPFTWKRVEISGLKNRRPTPNPLTSAANYGWISTQKRPTDRAVTKTIQRIQNVIALEKKKTNPKSFLVLAQMCWHAGANAVRGAGTR